MHDSPTATTLLARVGGSQTTRLVRFWKRTTGEQRSLTTYSSLFKAPVVVILREQTVIVG